MSSNAESADWGMNDVAEELVRKSIEGEAGAPPETLSAPTKKTALMLSSLIFHFDGDAEELAENDFYRLLMSRLETYAVQDAKQSGSVSQMRAIAGQKSMDEGVDMADWKQYEVLKDLFREDPEIDSDLTNRIFQCVIFSNAIPPTGRGKTNTAYTLIEFAQLVHDDLRVITNNTSDPFETVPEQWADLEHEIKKDSDQWKLLLIDEAAQFLQYADQGAGKSISQRLKLLRHNRCHIILIGHTGRDIPADIRRQVFVMNKTDQKTAQLGYGIQPMTDDDRMEVANEVYQFSGIPETDVNYDDIDDEGIEIKFDADEPTVSDDADSDKPDSCRLCSRTVGIDADGFCPDHSEDDLDEAE